MVALNSLVFIAVTLLGLTTAAPPAPDPDRVLDVRQTLLTSPPPTDAAFINTCLTKVNAIRAKYAAPALVWKAAIAQVALTKSNSCKVYHTGIYGENAYWMWFTPATTVPNFTTYTNKAFDAWVSAAEITAYKNGGLLSGRHFTQTVWKASKRIGCAWSTHRCMQNTNQEWFFTCNFDPRGNVKPYYASNVTTTPVARRHEDSGLVREETEYASEDPFVGGWGV
ncbi:CAP domain-containing protein [Apodospora peruviana]|uniref:CAP domain-containing protein n=1 Tax=Apodospora peruviana TaxID=516989 RepID=A0AAE0I5F0_9PEZI|nr:CAP domain-containing protein [Apodospora peruviana]